ncbi:amidohydrolase family protein [Saccharothrix violaceirubra]|uniref:Cytosine/adenosine deaminase-related metal-dependent hydrolase n=1 Tax=Saccharothrix violaceirubra TaxID=413306 RepID=A0A7W7T6C3_9PSEU|nr:amidohydrolase family protein [Saccharothrix violaceirubra]MBB4967360.1 cytosine/adenosine deaminase-related metal-dependent hydrolase [Saccharothrix violaceirubra]
MAALLVTGGTLYPADAAASVIPDGAVLVEDGRITAVGPAAEVAAPADAQVVDATGTMILPGFVNAHWHDLFALRFPLRGALRPPHDRDDKPAFLALGGDLHQVTTTFDAFAGRIALLDPDEAAAIARYSLWTQLRSGVTTLGDVGSFNRPDALADAALFLGVRASVSTWASDAVCEAGATRFRRTRDADGVLAEIEALLQRAEADTTGLLRARPTAVYGVNMTDELGRGLADLAARHDVPFATHVGALRNEPEVSRTYFGASPVRRLADLGLLGPRTMAVHTAFVDEDERKLLVDNEVHISISPAKYGHAGESTLTETGLVPVLRRAGLDVSLSTDGGAVPVGGMAEAMKAAYQAFNELAADPTDLRPTDALAMATSVAARGLDWAGEIGSLEVGKRGDLVLVPADDWRYLLNPRPLEGFLALGGSTDVDTVIVDGKVLVRGGRAVLVDETELEADYLDAVGSFSVRVLGVPPEVVRAATGRRATKGV